ncbi:hypothetical protein EG344_19310 [Chryseobacterium sp. G0162]|uniref:hypothetical protein n=1 Tax=Chryseobacterium sp. G0162 TaxID=2487063 RepID=UPI000F4E3C57|nr:hypothetical protein [Chryseobacterium sp. G0162]AZB10831.1 hypothetical protein EG344_19310 [Chryseobacterium sp. G0162]
MPVRNALDKSTSYFFEIKTHDGAIFYFLNKDTDWKGESPIMKLVSKHPLFSLKTKERVIVAGKARTYSMGCL